MAAQSDPKSQADALGALASHSTDATHSVPDLVAAAKAPTTAGGAAVTTASQAPQPRPPQTVAEAKARSQRGLELLTNVIHVLEDAARTVNISGKHTRSAIDHTFKQAYIQLTTSAENVKRASDSIGATNNRMAKAIRTLEIAGAGGIDPADLTEIKSQLAAIAEKLEAAGEPPDLGAITESLEQVKSTIQIASSARGDQSDASAEAIKDIAKSVDARFGKLTLLVALAMACSIFAALCAFGGILAMLLTGK
jgi:hypothetical protein